MTHSDGTVTVSRARTIRIILLLCLLGPLAVMSVIVGLSGGALASGRTQLALSIWGGNAAALASEAEVVLETDRYQDARRLAARAFSVSAQDKLALRTFAVAAKRQGDEAASVRVIQSAARQSWRDGFVQFWNLDTSIAAGDFISAARAGDALMRIDFQRNTVLRKLIPLVETDAGRKALADRLSAHPPWAPLFLARLRLANEPQIEGFIELVHMMDEYGARPTDADIRPFFEQLISRGKVAEAVRLWRGSNPEASGDPSTGIVDGGFDQLATQAGSWGFFGWRIAPNARNETATSSRNDFSENPVLAITVDRGREKAFISQYLALHPGNYVFSFSADVVDQAQYSLSWQMTCVSGGAKTPLIRDRATYQSGWANYRLRMVIPENCPVQRLVLRGKNDSVDELTGRFDDISISAR
ncbi:MAG: hypothetical protein EON58_09790 [Alphaproteobacteria bacterium]|nr:MAG: hypothetical protein EON58_09790 [Alphaproteobacteria bacterium]